MRSSALTGRKSSFAFALGLVWLVALGLQAAEPAQGGRAGSSPAGRSAAGTRGIRVAAHPAPPPKPGKASKKEPASRKSNGDGKEPTTFAEAFARGKQALDEAQAAIVGMRMAEDQQTVDPELKTRLTTEQQERQRSAMADFRLALSLAGKGPVKERPDADQLNTARHYLCFLYYDSGQYYDAAVLGDFLARHATDTPQGREGAKILLASFIKLYGDSKEADKSFETKKIRETAEYIIAHWPTEPEAEDAALSLLNFAIADRRLDDAIGYLNRISTDSPRRGQSDLYAGQALWGAYLKASQAPAEERPPQAELDRFKSQARQVLKEGVERIKQGAEPSAAIAAAMLSLAQIYLDMNEGQLAIDTLEDPKFGPLTLVQEASPLVSRPGFATETYKVAVRAYVAQRQAAKAKTVMDAMDKAIGESGDPAANDMLTAIYVSLGRELQQQLERLRKEGSKEDLDAVSDAFETFLSRISSRKSETNYSSLSWVAETFYSLAATVDDPTMPAVDRAKSYYKHAAEAYRQILDRAAKDPKFVPNPDNLAGVQLRAAVSCRRIGDYDEAIKLIVEVLKQRPKMLTAQIAGAETFAAQGAVDRDGYIRSIMGGAPDRTGHNVIWGWIQLARVTQGNSQYEETFYLARLKIAEGRLLFGLKETDLAKREKVLDAAKNDLWVTFRIYPDLGGPQSSSQYDMLLKRIQQQLHQPLQGLREFKQRQAASDAEKDQKDSSA